MVPKRIYPVFRDREELPTSSDLGANINQALKASRYLVVICSPKSAVSRWVNEEVKAFKAMGGEGRILCLIVDGEPNASDRPDSGLLEWRFPQAVRRRVDAQGQVTPERTEPIAADARGGKDGKSRRRGPNSWPACSALRSMNSNSAKNSAGSGAGCKPQLRPCCCSLSSARPGNGRKQKKPSWRGRN